MDNQNNAEFIKILSFMCDNTFFAFELCSVTDIMEIPEITYLPGVDDFILGLINLRGKTIPVVDLHKRLGLKEFEYDKRSGIIIIEVKSAQLGVLCDRIADEENILIADISPSPVKNGVVKGFINTPKKRISILEPINIIPEKNRGV